MSFCRCPPKGTFSLGQDYVDSTRGRLRPPKGVLIQPGQVTPSAKPDLPRSTAFNARKHFITKTLVRYVPQGTAGEQTGTRSVVAFIRNPSDRLKCTITVAFEADDTSATDPAFSVQPTWTLRAMFRNPETGRESSGQLVYPPASIGGTSNLPDGYELDSGIDLVRLEATFSDGDLAASFVPTTKGCNVVLAVTWEPNIDISDQERDQLYNEASISSPNPILIRNNAT